MRIAVDARELVGSPTGVGRYLHELLTRWSTSPDAQRHEWQLFAHGPVGGALPPGSGVVVLPGSGGTRWEQVTLPRALAASRPDVLFAPGYSAPLAAPCPTLVTVHDVSFAAHPEWFAWREGLRRRLTTAWSARRAALVATDSQFSAAEIVRTVGIPRHKVRVIPLGVPDQAAGQRVPAAAGREPLVLFVGSIFQRRHVDTLIRVFAERVAPRVPGSRLEIVGANRTFPRQDLAGLVGGLDPRLAGRIGLRAYVDEPTLRDLYGRAAAFAFLSEYEGFGLTPLEALAAGVPPVVLDTPIAREVYGEAAWRVPADLGSLDAIADGLVRLLTSDEERTRILRHAEATLARYDWRRTAADTLAAIVEAGGA